ncbi:hypothetical protein UlMin_019939 [Ulmus minor]
MLRGLKKHIKRLNAPKHWMLDKLGGAFVPKPSSGPHKSRECIPLILIPRNRLKYALTYYEAVSIMMQCHVMVDGRFIDVVSIPKTNEKFCLLYNTNGHFHLHSIRDDEDNFKLCKVCSYSFGHSLVSCSHRILQTANVYRKGLHSILQSRNRSRRIP